MAQEITVTAKLVDEMSPEIKKIRETMDAEFKKVGSAATGTSAIIEESSNRSSESLLRMGSAARGFGQDLMSGNVVGAVQNFARMSIAAFRSIGTQLAIATGGVSLLVGALAVASSKARETLEEARRAGEALQDEINRWNRLRLDSMKDGFDKEKKMLDDKKSSDMAAQKAIMDEQIRRNAEFNGKTLQDFKNQDAIFRNQTEANRAITKSLEERYESDIAALRKKYSDKKAADDKVVSDKAETARKAEWAWKRDAIVKQHEEQEKMAKDYADKNEEIDRAIVQSFQDAQNQKMQAAQRSAMEISILAANFGAAMAAGVGKGAEGFKESLKAVLNVGISFLEQKLFQSQAAAIFDAIMTSGLSIGPNVAALVAGTAALETARAGINSFQTSPGEFKTVPGPMHQGQLAIVHGGETIGRPGVTNNNQRSIHIHVEGGGSIDSGGAQVLARKLDDLARNGYFNNAYNLKSALARA